MKRSAAIIGIISLVCGAFWAGTQVPRRASAENEPANTNPAVLLPGFKITERTSIGGGAQNMEIDMLPGFSVLISKGEGAGGLPILNIHGNLEDDAKTYVELLLDNEGGYSVAVSDKDLGDITHFDKKQLDVTTNLDGERMLLIDTNRDGYLDKRVTLKGPNRGKREALRWSVAKPHELYQAAHPEEEIIFQEVLAQNLRREVGYFYGYVFAMIQSFGERFPECEGLSTYVKQRLDIEREAHEYRAAEVDRFEELHKKRHGVYKYEKRESGVRTMGIMVIDEKGRLIEDVEQFSEQVKVP